MTKFEKASLPDSAFDIAHIMKAFNMTKEQAKEVAQFNREQQVFMNDKYQVNIRDAEIQKAHGDWPEMLHLSIKLISKEPIHDWRELWEIKNELVGEENEAVEIYPAASRLVDSANQYHLWVFKDPNLRLPFGFQGEFVMEGSLNGSKQRGFSK